ncbi:NUDIX hydrolase [Candidatus Nomurabacteria bacterium]|nr:NUDIX hydrolase [Candidatus Nomurabacteria bacterium]
MRKTFKALLVPLNSKKEILIQDRKGYKKPDWGYFGGSIEEGETPIKAMIRETKEELDLDLTEKDLKYLVMLKKIYNGNEEREGHFFLYNTNQEKFSDLEANGAYWFSLDEAKEHMIEHKEELSYLFELIEKTT